MTRVLQKTQRNSGEPRAQDFGTAIRVSKLLRALRQPRSAEQLAAYVGVHDSTVRRWISMLREHSAKDPRVVRIAAYEVLERADGVVYPGAALFQLGSEPDARKPVMTKAAKRKRDRLYQSDRDRKQASINAARRVMEEIRTGIAKPWPFGAACAPEEDLR